MEIRVLVQSGELLFDVDCRYVYSRFWRDTRDLSAHSFSLPLTPCWPVHHGTRLLNCGTSLKAREPRKRSQSILMVTTDHICFKWLFHMLPLLKLHNHDTLLRAD